jgi:uncharacterized protein (TIGR01777 family)
VRFLVAGGSGFLGRNLASCLTSEGHEVRRLTRRDPESPDEVRWDPYADRLDQDEVDAADVVVNLAGSPLVGNPYSSTWRRQVRESRVVTTRVLADAVAASDQPAVLLAGNGVTYYGDHGAETVTEDADSRGDGLLTRVTREWQQATEPASAAGARVCVLRTSPVIDRDSLPLSLMRWPWRLGLGARIGDGRQYFPCISLRDWVGAVTFLATADHVSGPVNLCCPHTPTNAEFTDALADALGRKALLFVPSPLLRTAAGEVGPMLLDSVNAVPAVLQQAGYRFADHDVRDVIAAALAR